MSNTKHNTNDTAAAHQGLNCSLCLYCDTCDHNEPCEYLAPTDDDAYAKIIMEQVYDECGSVYRDSADNNCDIDYFLRDIRDGRIAYVYKKEHIAEILRFEPDINVVHKDGIFYITL